MSKTSWFVVDQCDNVERFEDETAARNYLEECKNDGEIGVELYYATLAAQTKLVVEVIDDE